MDEFLATVGVQAMRYAIRSGISLTSTYVLGQCSRLLKSVGDRNHYAELRALQKLFDSKIKIISPAIDLVELKSGRGNVFLESAVPLTKSLHRQITSLGRRIEAVATLEEAAHKTNSQTNKQCSTHCQHLFQVIADIRCLLDRIDREIPLLQLAITASGESLSTSLPGSVSPSRLLQASTLLVVGDTQFAQDPTRPVQIGPAFSLSLYMLFVGHASPKSRSPGPDDGQCPVYGLGESDRKPLWQEVMHKARVRLYRVAERRQPNDGKGHRLATTESLRYEYHLEVAQDLNDGRVHDETEAASYDALSGAGVRETIPIYQLSKIFYTDTGRILNIGNAGDGENNPVLLLKRDMGESRPPGANCDPGISMMTITGDESDNGHGDGGNEQAGVDRQLREETFGVQCESPNEPKRLVSDSSQLPKHLDPEWIALEVYGGDDEIFDDDSETDGGSESEPEDLESTCRVPKWKPESHRASLDSQIAAQIQNLSLASRQCSGGSPDGGQVSARNPNVDEAGALDFVARSPFRTITSSLSLIEMLVRLAGLQEFQQTSHLSIPDHILTFFLEETSTTGLAGEARRSVRNEAKRRVGFDPYTDTPTE